MEEAYQIDMVREDLCRVKMTRKIEMGEWWGIRRYESIAMMISYLDSVC